MKIVTIPAPLFELGDTVLTPDGMAVVDRDDLADILCQNLPLPALLEKLSCSPKAHVNLLEETCTYSTRDYIAMDRYDLIQQ